MLIRAVVGVIVSILVLTVSTESAYSQRTCATRDQALGFATEEILDAFLSLAGQGADSPTDLRAFLQRLVSRNEAFVLKGGDTVTIIQEKSNKNPLLGKLKVRARDRIFWVPSGALDCN